MKTIKQIREEYDSIVLDQVQNAPDELMLEGRESASKLVKTDKVAPSPNEMPTMLLFRRIAYRLYPNKQVVALYYSKTVDKYLSIPFGPDGNLNVSESVIHDHLEEGVLKTAAKTAGGALSGGLAGATLGATAAPVGTVVGGLIGAGIGARKAYKKAKEQEKMEEDWQDVNRKDKTDGLSQKAVNAYRRENPGSKLKTAVTEKNPTGKRASRRKSFCSRMGGMKKRLTSAKNARDPDSPINKALRRWNCEESFRAKLSMLREAKGDENDLSGIIDTAISVVPGARAYQKWKEGDKAGAAKSAALDLALGGAAKVAGKAYKFLKGSRAAKATAGAGAAGAAATVADNLSKKVDDFKKDSSDAITKSSSELIRKKPSIKTSSSWVHSPSAQQSQQQAQPQQKVAENKIADIKNMLNEGIETMDLSINGRTVTLNNSMAKKIIRVYESVNTKNKKIVESMLNEDLDSFKKLLNFSIKA